MTCTRRQWLLGSSSLALSTSLLGCSSQPSAKNTAAAGYVHHTLGKARITAISDGITARPLDANFVRNAPLAQVQSTLAAAGLPTSHLDVPYTCFVVDLDGHRYLLDTGFADNGAPSTGQLHSRLRAAGIDPASIDRILLSHLHGDHIHGLRRKDGSLVYPKATVYVPQPEIAFWMDDARMQAAPTAARGGFENVRRVFKDYPAAQLKTFVLGTVLAPCLSTIAAFGHSPGHTAFRIQSGQERFTYIGDTAHYPTLFVQNPDWQVQFDMNPEQARTTRRTLLGQLADQGDWVGGYHFPLPAIGKVQRTAQGFAWTPK